MKKFLFVVCSVISIRASSQEDSIVIIEEKKEITPGTKIFHSQKLINSKTADVLQKGIMEFGVYHNFGDIGGDAGGVERFFGLDQAMDIRIGFQTGLSNRINLITARTRGAGLVQQMWELGIKWQILKQVEKDPKRPLSLTLFANDVVSSQKSGTVAGQENYFEDFGSRHSQVVQLMLAKKIGKVSLQISPIYLNTAYVIENDDKNIFALGGAIRLPLSKKIVIIADYFHPFHSDEAEAYFKTQDIEFKDPLGIGIEILTEGHVFHLNFTNATELIENRFIRRTVSSWGDGQFRWSFTLSRNFVLFRSKGNG